jgi:hypothetical protein
MAVSFSLSRGAKETKFAGALPRILAIVGESPNNRFR